MTLSPRELAEAYYPDVRVATRQLEPEGAILAGYIIPTVTTIENKRTGKKVTIKFFSRPDSQLLDLDVLEQIISRYLIDVEHFGGDFRAVVESSGGTYSETEAMIQAKNSFDDFVADARSLPEVLDGD